MTGSSGPSRAYVGWQDSGGRILDICGPEVERFSELWRWRNQLDGTRALTIRGDQRPEEERQGETGGQESKERHIKWLHEMVKELSCLEKEKDCKVKVVQGEGWKIPEDTWMEMGYMEEEDVFCKCLTGGGAELGRRTGGRDRKNRGSHR